MNKYSKAMTPDSIVVHTLARLLAGLAEKASDNGVPEPWKGIIGRLTELDLEDRLAALEEEVTRIPGISWDLLLQSVFALDPLNPVPETTDQNSFQFPPIHREKTETNSKLPETVVLADFLSQEDAKISWVVRHILPAGGVGILAGPAGYGKSWMLLDLAVECARGGRWLGRFSTTSGRILYLDEESTPTLLRHRLRKLLNAKSLQGTKLDVYFGVGQGICLNDQASAEGLRQVLQALQPALVIVDSLIRVHRAEENSASEMSRVFAVVKALTRDFGCTFLFSDHQRKPGSYGTSQDLLLRGSSDKVAFVDTLLSLRRKDGALIVEHSKSRFAEPVSSFVVRIEDTAPGATSVACMGDAEALKKAARQEEASAFLEEAVPPDQWTARKDLVSQAKEIGISAKVLDETLKALEEDGRIVREDRKPEKGPGRKTAFYRWKIDPNSFHVSPPI